MSVITRAPANAAPDEMPWFPDWSVRARCRGMFSTAEQDLFFDYGRDSRKIRRAKAICQDCPVRLECLTDNLEVPYGIFGGLTEAERSDLCGGPLRAPRGAAAWAVFARNLPSNDPSHHRVSPA